MKDKKTLIVIEDNELNREMLAMILGDEYEILEAENGAEGLKILNEKGKEISLILLDIQMPVMNGYEFLEAVFSEGRFSDIPIIVTTSSNSDEEQLKCLSLGASDFVTKPYKNKIVKKRVDGLIRLRETARTLNKVEHDAVTGLYNRESFGVYAERLIPRIKDQAYDMVCVEIESYLSIQSRYGLDKCNAYLKNLAAYLRAVLPEGSIVGRIDSSRIAVLMPHISCEDHKALSKEFVQGDYNSDVPSVKINIGIYLNIDISLDLSSIVFRALSPIGQIHGRKDKYIAFFDDELNEKHIYESRLSACAEDGIKEKQFKVWYQPKHSAKSDKTEGAEALIRWIHPEFGFISPGAFIPLFETNGFVPKIDFYVIETVCSDLRRWMDEGKKTVPVSANISQVDFDIPELADMLEAIVDKYNIPHELIHFEITESAEAGDKQKKSVVVRELVEKGFTIELDDFGSGYSNLSTLSELPIGIIKLDMSLVRNMFDPSHNAVLRGVMYTAAALGKKIVTEGVETEEQVKSLKDMCKGRVDLYYQGYYFSKPLPSDQFEAYLENH